LQTIETVAVLGASEAGTACAVLAALAGCTVRLHDPDPASLGGASEAVRRRVEIGVAQGAFTANERQRVLDGILFTSDLEEALTGADLAVDAASAPPPVARLAEALRATAAIAAAGAMPPAALAAAVPQPGRVLALRLAASGGPVPRLEVEAAPATTGHVLARARAFAARVNRAARLSSPGPGPQSTGRGTAAGPVESP
jgi:3-hydroxybutyryl-CoA dehydrogenase